MKTWGMIVLLMVIGVGAAHSETARVLPKSICGDSAQALDPLLVELADFFEHNSVVYLATVDGTRPCVRPVRYSAMIEGKIAIATSVKKGMSRQMMANPDVEISGASADGKQYARYAGKAAVCKDAKILAAFDRAQPKFKKMFGDDFVLYLIEPVNVGLFSNTKGVEPKTKMFAK